MSGIIRPTSITLNGGLADARPARRALRRESLGVDTVADCVTRGRLAQPADVARALCKIFADAHDRAAHSGASVLPRSGSTCGRAHCGHRAQRDGDHLAAATAGLARCEPAPPTAAERAAPRRSDRSTRRRPTCSSSRRPPTASRYRRVRPGARCSFALDDVGAVVPRLVGRSLNDDTMPWIGVRQRAARKPVTTVGIADPVSGEKWSLGVIAWMTRSTESAIPVTYPRHRCAQRSRPLCDRRSNRQCRTLVRDVDLDACTG